MPVSRNEVPGDGKGLQLRQLKLNVIVDPIDVLPVILEIDYPLTPTKLETMRMRRRKEPILFKFN